jgi:hypothetical protein
MSAVQNLLEIMKINLKESLKKKLTFYCVSQQIYSNCKILFSSKKIGKNK